MMETSLPVQSSTVSTAEAAQRLQFAQTLMKQDRNQGWSRLNKLFRQGSFPEQPLSGPYVGELIALNVPPGVTRLIEQVTSVWMPWQGKHFRSETNQGNNIFDRSTRVHLLFPYYCGFTDQDPDRYRAFPFETYPGPGRVDVDRQVLKLDYNRPDNPGFPIRIILDELVQIGDGVYLGKVHMKLLGRWLQVAFFSLAHPDKHSEVNRSQSQMHPSEVPTMPNRYQMRRSTFSRLYSTVFGVVNRYVPWHRLPTWISVLNLLAFRDELRERNLHDTSFIDRDFSPRKGTGAPRGESGWDPAYRSMRTVDGRFNDLDDPEMGSAGSRFGRNFALDHVWPDKPPVLYDPSPRAVSRQLLARDTFKPATTLNVLAAAWIQFQNHEWFNHVRNPDEFHEIALSADDDWHENPMRIERTAQDPTRQAGSTRYPPTFLSSETHWWDGSQIYSSRMEKLKQLRTGRDGKLRIEENGLLPLDPDRPGVDLTGFNDNMWAGLSLLHTLFALEHNAICNRLRQVYRSWDDEHLFATARLINSALMAKIHTVEWTPAILGHPALQIGMAANWWGLASERITKLFGRLGDSEVLSGIPGSPTDHHTAPFYLTEEFVSVYRMHPLIPDDYEFYSLSDDALLEKQTFEEIQGSNTRPTLERFQIEDLWYSFGIAHPGAVTLHNYPRALRAFRRPDGHTLDLAAVDIMRDRERGVPRYNKFRQLLNLPRVQSFEELTDNPEWAREIQTLYKGNIDQVDLMVGLYAEPLPKGFGFSDTAFRIFILMASRRLKSDRFLTRDYRPEVYTQVGIDWINNTEMKDVLVRHYPKLMPAIQGAGNVFAPWDRVSRW